MAYPDSFLDALGAWQKGWREQADRRLEITADLLSSIKALATPLPVSATLPLCYRKRFLVPNNPQNGGDFEKLVMFGRIDEGVASWTSDPEFHLKFKLCPRFGETTALFAHQPTSDEVVVDFAALWNDEEFERAVDDYHQRGGAQAGALLNFRNDQQELVLTAPLCRDELVDMIGQISGEDFFYDAFGATTEGERDAIWSALVELKVSPGGAKWSGGEAVQRALVSAQQVYIAKVRRRIARRWFKALLSSDVSLTALATGLRWIRQI